MAKKKEEEENIDKSKEFAKRFLKENKDLHFNDEEDVTYKVSSGSLILDSMLGGGFFPGLVRKCGIFEGGKEQPVSEPVLSKDGWKPIGDLKVGDLIYGSNGDLQEVLGVYPQGKKDVYEVEFDDGRKVRCGLEHLWETSSMSEKQNSRKKGIPFSSPKSLKCIKETLKYGTYPNHAVRICDPINFEKKHLKINPYLLGVLIGDGGITASVTISSGDQEIFNKVQEIINKEYEGCSMTYREDITKSLVFKSRPDNPIKTALKELNLFGKKSHEKFIPKDYLYSSIEDRLSLLQGLVDTDAHIHKVKSGGEYYTSSNSLRDGFIDLVRSLGGIARLYKPKKSHYRDGEGKKVPCRDCYRIQFWLPEGVIPCTLARKIKDYTFRELNFCHFIKNVEKVGEEESVCIKVSNKDSLYVTSDYTLTHNTSSALNDMKEFLLTIPKAKGLLIKAEGRLSKDMKERSGVKFVYDPDEWVEGTCFVFECNIYEVVMEFMNGLIDQNDQGYRYCFLLDSVDGLIPEGDMSKSFYDSHKVAGGAVIAAVFSKKVSQKLAKRGHLAIFISQVRADIKLDQYSKEPSRQIVSTGGNALLHFADFILEYQQRYKKDLILKDPNKPYDPKKNPYVGHWAKVIIRKSPNEITNELVSYPIKYGRTGGKSIWVEKEIIDVLLGWGYVSSKGAWITISEDLREKVTEAELEIPEKINGAQKFFDLLESDEKLTKFLFEFAKTEILNKVY